MGPWHAMAHGGKTAFKAASYALPYAWRQLRRSGKRVQVALEQLFFFSRGRGRCASGVRVRALRTLSLQLAASGFDAYHVRAAAGAGACSCMRAAMAMARPLSAPPCHGCSARLPLARCRSTSPSLGS